MGIIAELYKLVGSLICHQIPSRTLCVGGMSLPVCARDTGIYAGIFFALVFVICKKRFNSDKPPCLKFTLVLCLFMLPMVIDGITSYIGLRNSTNTIRLFTGILFGVPILFFLIPAANFKVFEKNTKEVLKNWNELLLLLIICILFCLAIFTLDFLPWFLVSSIIIIGLVFLIAFTIYVIFARMGITKCKCFIPMLIGAVIGCFVGMFILSNCVLRPLADKI